MRRVLYLAIAEARGHLMRAHLLRRLCSERGVEVDIVTNSRQGVEFLAELGSPAALVSEHFKLAYDERHNLDQLEVDLRTAKYLAHPGRFLADVRSLRRRAKNCTLVVNDSYHPAAIANLLGRPIVHVFGENMRQAVVSTFDRYPPPMARLVRHAFDQAEARAIGRIEHTLGRGRCLDARTVQLPPIMPAPSCSSAAVRVELGVGERKLAVAYLNPRFRDPSIAEALEEGARAAGFELYAVGEGYAGRAGWRAVDPDFVDKVAASDVLISGAGMGALAMNRSLGVPLLCLMGDQPEQRANLEFVDERDPVRVLEVGSELAASDVASGLRDLSGPKCSADASELIRALHQQWADALMNFVDQATSPTQQRRRVMNERHTSALVIETNNLRGGEADEETVVRGLVRLFRRLEEQTHPLSTLDEVVVTHDGIGFDNQHMLSRVAGVEIKFELLEPDTNYYEAKNVGFDATTSDVVVFADSDCWPDPGWLEALLDPFKNAETKVVAGRTTYRDDVFGIAATTIDFMYWKSPLGSDCTRNFYANNVAFRRDVFGLRRFPGREAIYRGPCQVLGLRLQADGVPVRFEPRARTMHRFPDTTREFAALRLLRGQDAAEFSRDLGEAYLPKGLRWLMRLGPVSATAVLSARFGYSLRALGNQDMPEVRGLRKLASIGLIAGISGLDGVGALGRSLRILDHRRGGGNANSVLSYHDEATASPQTRSRERAIAT